MTIQQMKNAIANVYDTTSWRNKVERMYDAQIVAIYYNFSNRGILNKVMKSEKQVAADKNKQKEKYQQLSFFDMIEQ